MNIRVRGRVNFVSNILSLDSFGHETKPCNRYNHEQYFQEIFYMSWGMYPKSRPFIVYQPTAIKNKL